MLKRAWAANDSLEAKSLQIIIVIMKWVVFDTVEEGSEDPFIFNPFTLHVRNYSQSY